MTALVDGDIIAFRCAAASEGDPVEIALIRTDIMVMDILDKEDNHIIFLTGSETKYPFTQTPNFRNLINPEYKQNRKKEDPVHLDDCRKYLIEEYGAVVTEGYEADDALGFNQTNETVIYTIDKDLQMIPGCHYNFIKKEYFEVDEVNALRTFYKQMLIGDTSDNIFGISKIGKVKAAKLIDHLESEEEMYGVVFDLYTDSDTTFNERFWMNADCLWIWRKKDETFSKRYENNEKNSS